MTLPTKRFVLLGLASPLFILNSQVLAIETTKESLSNCGPVPQKKKQVRHAVKKSSVVPPRTTTASSHILPKKTARVSGCALPKPPAEGVRPIEESWRMMINDPPVLQPVTTVMIPSPPPPSFSAVPEPSALLLAFSGIFAIIAKKQRFARPKENPRS
jgi:hypothetical protein